MNGEANAWERSSTLDNLCVNSISIQIHAIRILDWREPNRIGNWISIFIIIMITRFEVHGCCRPFPLKSFVFMWNLSIVSVAGGRRVPFGRTWWWRSGGRRVGKGFQHEICKLETVSFQMRVRHTFCHFGSLCSLNLIDFHVTAKCWRERRRRDFNPFYYTSPCGDDNTARRLCMWHEFIENNAIFIFIPLYRIRTFLVRMSLVVRAHCSHIRMQSDGC